VHYLSHQRLGRQSVGIAELPFRGWGTVNVRVITIRAQRYLPKIKEDNGSQAWSLAFLLPHVAIGPMVEVQRQDNDQKQKCAERPPSGIFVIIVVGI
jgi:hypothetical protein